MNTTNLEIRTPLTDAETGRLRTLVADIDQQLTPLPGSTGGVQSGSSSAALRGSWAELLQLLALGLAPEVRECPVCGNVGMRTATLCGYCWSKLRPPGSS